MNMIRMVEGTVPERLFAKYPSNKNQCSPADLRFLHLLTYVGQGSVDELLIGPSHTVGYDHRAVLAVERGQGIFNVLEIPDGKMDG